MKRILVIASATAVLAVGLMTPEAQGQGGLRGRGGGGAGGPGAGRPSLPSRPNSAPSISRPSAGGNRPAFGGNTGAIRPNPGGVGTNRPGNLVNLPRPGGNQPAPGNNRPGIGNNTPGPGNNRPGLGNNAPGLGSNRPGNNLPGAGNNRPGPGDINRPGLGNNRPGIGNNPGLGNNRPGNNLPGAGNNRPGLGDINRPGLGDHRPGIGNNPGPGNNRPGNNLPGLGNNRPGFGNNTPNLPGLRPNHRPGRPNGPGIVNRPGIQLNPGPGRPWTNFQPGGSRNDWINGRHNQLNNSFNDLTVNWNNRNHWNQVGPGNADWRHFHDHYYHNHYGWYHGYWPTPAGYWNPLWYRYPAALAFGITPWGLNTLNYRFGLGGYYNPYYAQPVIYNNQQIVTYAEPLVPPVQVASADPDMAVPQMAEEKLNDARAAFYDQQYPEALALTNEALASSPKDAVINEFRALCLFALGNYQEAAATIHAVLAVGPGWDWTTLSSMYPSNDVYTAQLRKLEGVTKSTPDDPAAHFLLAYHYMTCRHQEAAAKQLQDVVRLVPRDDVAKQLLQLTGGTTAPEPMDLPPPPDYESPGIPLPTLQGTWKAEGSGHDYTLVLTPDNQFTWTFREGDKTASLTGAYTLRAKSLAMEPDDGGVMLADVDIDAEGKMKFEVIGGGPALTFHR